MQNSSCPVTRSAYVHVPFCRHRCGYCNFAVLAGRDDLTSSFLDAIRIESRQYSPAHSVDTLYFGGGTPTHLSAKEFASLFEEVVAWRTPATGAEVTVEANPADIDLARISQLSKLTVNRISLGGQSFHDKKLRLLERDHQPEAVRQAIESGQNQGMQVSLDLIFAVPGETRSDWQADLTAAVAHNPDHISTYGLTFEKGTTFWNRLEKGQLEEVPDDLQRDMYLDAIDYLTQAGYEHYEVSSFAKPGCRSRHNQTYWSGAGYDAIGPGAARYLSNIRETNHRSVTTYLKRVHAGESPVEEREQLSADERLLESLVVGLRRIEGVHLSALEKRIGVAFSEGTKATLTRQSEQGFLHIAGDHVKLTREGLLVSDGLWPELL